MPANLTPQYQKAEDEYRQAQTAGQRVEILERMLKLIPKHKGTEKLQADLKTRLKETRGEVESEKSAPKAARGVRIPRQGAGTVMLIGGPNSGKSRILAELTRAEPEVADYPFTTREPLPGMMAWEDVSVQLIDSPPITASHMEPYLLGMVRSADAVLLCFDGSSDDAPEQTCEVIDQFASRKTQLARRTGFAEDDLTSVQVSTLLVVTRSAAADVMERLAFLNELRPDLDLPVLNVRLDDSASVEQLRNAVYALLGVIRVYTRKPGQSARYVDPFTIRADGTIEDLALKVHHDIAEGLKFARVWGQSVHDGQSVGREHVLADRDMVELHV